jgi:hypothetical protein
MVQFLRTSEKSKEEFTPPRSGPPSNPSREVENLRVKILINMNPSSCQRAVKPAGHLASLLRSLRGPAFPKLPESQQKPSVKE